MSKPTIMTKLRWKLLPHPILAELAALVVVGFPVGLPHVRPQPRSPIVPTSANNGRIACAHVPQLYP